MRLVSHFLQETAARLLPRILTQICRDPESPSYGCADRDWWHYKIRDFPSIILQQAGAPIAAAAHLDMGRPDADALGKLARAACVFWSARARRHGAFEEYYPFENGYPPLAFSTLAVAGLCAEGLVSPTEIHPGLKVASRQLLSRFESQAANQQVAGAAALAILRSVQPDLVSAAALARLLDRTFALQNSEGWFPEYDGPDLGYLSVTMDALWDIYDHTGDDRSLRLIESAFKFMSWFVLGPLQAAGMHNSRNTDYILPYGLVRLACSDLPVAPSAAEVVTLLFQRQSGQPHFFDAIDDRYWCHYTGRSVFRALRYLTEHAPASNAFPSAQPTAEASALPLSGHVLLQVPPAPGPSVLISTRKGGILTAVWPGGSRVSDFGWIVVSGRSQFVSHWWSTAWSTTAGSASAICAGPMVAHREVESTPWKHMGLRLVSFLAGASLIRFLKARLIFKPTKGRLHFERSVRIEGKEVIVEDRISGLHGRDRLVRAPRSSKRHVASADSFHPEDLKRIEGVTVDEHLSRTPTQAVVETRYSIESP